MGLARPILSKRLAPMTHSPRPLRGRYTLLVKPAANLVDGDSLSDAKKNVQDDFGLSHPIVAWTRWLLARALLDQFAGARMILAVVAIRAVPEWLTRLHLRSHCSPDPDRGLLRFIAGINAVFGEFTPVPAVGHVIQPAMRRDIDSRVVLTARIQELRRARQLPVTPR